ncbi:MAG TPA: YCF48-related protein [Bacteroidales bacterium]|nr:YCF48-related protein [Bacteroidales bacterium]
MLIGGSGLRGQGTWERIPMPTVQFLKSVCFSDSLYGWVAGDSGIIFRTIDGGASWVRQETHATNDVEEVFFLNRRLGWASTYNFTTLPYGTLLLKTTDGGENWTPAPFPEPNLFITCILYLDSLNGWMGGEPHALLKTTDGGATWNATPVDTSTLAFFPVLCIKFYNERYGYAGGGRFDIAGVTWRTWNGGAMWYAINPLSAPADEVHGLHLFDSLHVMGAGGDPDLGYGVGMIRTADGGLTWNYEELDIPGNAYDLDFRNAREAWAPLGPRQKMIYSLDSGATWAVIQAPDSLRIYDVTFPDSLHGWAVGKDGAVLKYHPPVIPGTGDEKYCRETLVLHRATPNPATGHVTFSFSVAAPGTPVRVRLSINSLVGTRLAVVTEGVFAPGRHEAEFDVSLLPSGVYLCRMETPDGGAFRMATAPLRLVVIR